MSRVLQRGDNGPDVALLQRDLNVWYGYWGAPARELLDRDGDQQAEELHGLEPDKADPALPGEQAPTSAASS